jgi:hypothetical protein
MTKMLAITALKGYQQDRADRSSPTIPQNFTERQNFNQRTSKTKKKTNRKKRRVMKGSLDRLNSMNLITAASLTTAAAAVISWRALTVFWEKKSNHEKSQRESDLQAVGDIRTRSIGNAPGGIRPQKLFGQVEGECTEVINSALETFSSVYPKFDCQEWQANLHCVENLKTA